ncbi:hypothetical protein P0F65_18270 [Sphingomonas sp. I4]
MMGKVAAIGPGGTARLVDRRGSIDVRVAQDLADADPAALAAGANIAWIGGELIQFASARPLGMGIGG